jgi:hypothetical protein
MRKKNYIMTMPHKNTKLPLIILVRFPLQLHLIHQVLDPFCELMTVFTIQHFIFPFLVITVALLFSICYTDKRVDSIVDGLK